MGIKIFDTRNLSMASIVDEKLINYYVDEITGDYVIESVAEYLTRVTFEHRFPEVAVTMLIPKDGVTPAFSYSTTSDFSTGLADFNGKKYAFIGGLADINFIEIPHVDVPQSGMLSSLASRSVSVTFASPFDMTPIGRKNVHVYRVVEIEPGKPVDESVEFYNLVVTTTGFSLTIDTAESLTGVYIEFLFTANNQ